MLDELRRLMNDNCIDVFAVFSSDPHLSEYTGECDKYIKALSGFSGSAGTLVVEKDRAYLWTDPRYYIQAEKELSGKGIEVMKAGMPSVVSVTDHLAGRICAGSVLAFDKKTLSYADYLKITRLGGQENITDGADILRRSAGDMPERVFNPIYAMPDEKAGRSVTEKLSSVRSIIRRKYVPGGDYAYIISDLASIMWLFNLRGSDINYVPVAYSYAVISDTEATIFLRTASLDDEAGKNLSGAGVTVRDYEISAPHFTSDYPAVLADMHSSSWAVTEDAVRAGTYIECSDTEIIKKAVKNAAEIEGMRSSHVKDAAVMIKFIKLVKEMAEEGTLPDEFELGRMLDDMRLENGCSSLSFATICAYGENAAIVHYTADKESAANVCPRGFLLVDSGGQYMFEGTTDITRTIALGPLTDEEKKVYTLVLKGNLDLMNMVFPQGFKGSLLDAAAEEPLWVNGYFCGHGIGHGVGHYLSVHESEARISRNSLERECAFFPGIIVSDEPGVYIEGSFGVRLENLLLTVEAGAADGHKLCAFEPLTLVPFDKEAIDVTLLTSDEKDALSRYNALITEKVAPYLSENERDWLKQHIDIA